MRLGNGELHALVLPDGSAKNLAIANVIGDLVGEPAPVADAFGGNQGALCIQPGEDISEALPLFADQVFRRYLEIVKK